MHPALLLLRHESRPLDLGGSLLFGSIRAAIGCDDLGLTSFVFPGLGARIAVVIVVGLLLVAHRGPPVLIELPRRVGLVLR